LSAQQSRRSSARSIEPSAKSALILPRSQRRFHAKRVGALTCES
jgi:hypothetical protein